MKYVKRYSLIFFALVLLVSLIPFEAFADPVSATIIANAFAQAIAAYGASNGVAMTFDVANSNGIGENMHELWKSFRDGTQDADDYATLAAAIFPDLYYKTGVALGAATDFYAVGVHISDTYAEEFDNFYNWLLSGPAEMVQVDNQYYQFSQSQIGSESVPINVLHIGSGVWGDQPLPLTTSVGSDIMTYGLLAFDPADNYFVSSLDSNIASLFIFCNWTGSKVNFYFVSSAYNQTGYYCINPNYPVSLNTSNLDSTTGLYYSSTTSISRFYDQSKIHVPLYSDFASGMAAAADIIDTGVPADTIGVKSYDETGIADIPDTADPNYDALHRAKDIPLNIPWDDTIYGDGTGTLTDAESAAIAGDLTDALAEDGVIELVEEANPPAPDFTDVLLPLIPISIPSFNFNLSGIWHYVREWVNSISGWIALMFTIWASLPYAIIVPVYASLVVVIVLGIYKRFFM